MKIIYIANARIPTEKAHGIHIMKMCEALASLGHKVELVLPKRSNAIKENPFDYYGVKKIFQIKKLPCLDFIPLDKYLGHLGLWIESITFLFPLFFYMIFQKEDVIYARDKYALPLSFFRKNFILETHIFPKHYNLYASFLKRAKEIVVITRGLKNLFIEKGIAPEKILVAPDGVDIGKFQIPDSRFQIRERLGLPQSKKIVLYAGHLYEWKGVQTLAEASQYLPEDTEVYFVGGTEKDIDKFKIKNLKLKINVIGHRSYNEIPYWLKASDILVLPNSGKEEISRSWTSPMKLFEYMASKRPIVASDLPSLREVLNENNSILVEPDNPQALASGIKGALEDKPLSDKISESAFSDVQQYSWQKRAEKILNHIKN